MRIKGYSPSEAADQSLQMQVRREADKIKGEAIPGPPAPAAYHPYSGGRGRPCCNRTQGERRAWWGCGEFASSIFSDAYKRNMECLFPPPRPTREPRTATLAHLFRPILHSPPPPLNKKTMNKKIIPKFRKYAEEHSESGKSPVVIVTCSFEQKMCTYYVVSIVLLLLFVFIYLVSLSICR
jgi:hypothetical protein